MPNIANPQSNRHRSRFCIPVALGAMVWVIIALFAGCSAVQPMAEPDDQSYLELDVEPPTAEIYIDDDYSGTVAGWREQVVPIAPGQRRVELRAEGYIAQRFDVDVGDGRWLTLRVRMEPVIDGPGAGDNDDDDDDGSTIQMPAHPTAPDPNH